MLRVERPKQVDSIPRGIEDLADEPVEGRLNESRLGVLPIGGTPKARLRQTSLALNPRRGSRDQPSGCRLFRRSERGRGRPL